MSMQALYLLVPLAPLAGAIIAGLWGTKLFGNLLPMLASDLGWSAAQSTGINT